MVVDLSYFSAVRSLVCFLAVILSEACLHVLALTLYPSLFCHLHLCTDLSFNLLRVFGPFWLTSLLLQVSAMVTKIKDLKDLRGNPWLPLPRFLPRRLAAASVTALLTWVTMESRSASSSSSVVRCKSTTYICLENTHHCWIIQLFEVKPDSWLGWFPWILMACLESHHHHVMVASNICIWECSGSGSFNTLTEPFVHQDLVSLVVMCSIWAVSDPSSGWLMVA